MTHPAFLDLNIFPSLRNTRSHVTRWTIRPMYHSYWQTNYIEERYLMSWRVNVMNDSFKQKISHWIYCIKYINQTKHVLSKNIFIVYHAIFDKIDRQVFSFEWKMPLNFSKWIDSHSTKHYINLTNLQWIQWAEHVCSNVALITKENILKYIICFSNWT